LAGVEVVAMLTPPRIAIIWSAAADSARGVHHEGSPGTTGYVVWQR